MRGSEAAGYTEVLQAGALSDARRTDSIPVRFAAVTRRHRSRTALRWGVGAWSYAELARRAQRISRAIAEVAPRRSGNAVLLFEQGPEAIAAILGTLGAGRAFVPLDLAHAGERLERIVRDAAPDVVLTTARSRRRVRLHAPSGIPVVAVDDLPRWQPDEAEEAAIVADDLASIFYTSGSTGEPKGVCQTHRSLLHFVSAYAETLSIGREDRLSMLYSLSFSASNMDVFGALLNGATLCLYDIRTRGTRGLVEWLHSERVTVLHAVPTVARHLLSQLAPRETLDFVRAIDLGGEPVYGQDVERVRAHTTAECVLVNHYASTEACVVSQRVVAADEPVGEGVLSVGPAAAGVRVRVVDDEGRDTPAGEPGEVWIESPFVSTGYWRRRELTAAAFESIPEQPGWRRYRSGDRGRLGARGELFLLGRSDSRVKVRGHSVDPSEVESALFAAAGSPGIVVAQPGEDASRDLVAFVVEPPGRELTSHELRAALRRRLPEFMIPAEIRLLEDLPLTRTGKVDRRALADMADGQPAVGSVYEPPATELERCIADLVAHVLGRERVGRRDDFFAIGGNSLRAAELHPFLEDLAGTAIPLVDLFREPTVAGLADSVQRLQATGGGRGHAPPILVPLKTEGAKRTLFLMHGGKGQAFVSPHFLEVLGPEQPLWVFQAAGRPRARQWRGGMRQLVDDYLAALRGAQAEGPYLLGSLCAGSEIVLEMARRLEEAGHCVAPLVLIDPPVTPPGGRRFARRLLWRASLHRRRLALRLRGDDRLITRLRAQAENGKIAVDWRSGSALRTAALVALDLQRILLRHRPRAYDGAVIVLRSSERSRRDREAPGGGLAARLTGPVTWLEAGEKHRDVLDVHNELFAAQLRAALRIAHRGLGSAGGPSTATVAPQPPRSGGAS